MWDIIFNRRVILQLALRFHALLIVTIIVPLKCANTTKKVVFSQKREQHLFDCDTTFMVCFTMFLDNLWVEMNLKCCTFPLIQDMCLIGSHIYLLGLSI